MILKMLYIYYDAYPTSKDYICWTQHTIHTHDYEDSIVCCYSQVRKLVIGFLKNPLHKEENKH